MIMRTTMKKSCSIALACMLLLSLFCALPMLQAHAAQAPAEQKAPTLTTNLGTSANVAQSSDLTLEVKAALEGGDAATLEYEWFKDRSSISQGTGDAFAKYVIKSATDASAGTYWVTVKNPKDKTKSITSFACVVTVGQAGNTGGQTPASGAGLYVTGYTVTDQAGQELQRVAVGQKCKIIVGLRDGRVQLPLKNTDEFNNGVNVKITSTANFSSPSRGDIIISTPKQVDNEIQYAVTLNDITYLGGDTTLGMDVAYTDNSVAMSNIRVGISQCYDPAQLSTAKPTVMVKDIAYGSQTINAGQAFTLTLTSYNTSSSAPISDVVTSLTLPTSVTLAGGTNTVLTSKCAPGGSFTTNFSLQMQSSAETGAANIGVTYTYYIEGGKDQLTSTQTITVPVVQPDRFSFTSVQVPQEMFAGEEASLSVNYVNMGKGVLYNLSADITGNITNPGQGQYIGNLNSGTQGSVDFVLKSEGVGTISGVVTLTYEDVNGNQQKKTQEYSVNVLAAPVQDPSIMPGIVEPEPTNTGMPWWGWALIGLGVVVICVCIAVVVKKGKAKKRAAELSDDGDDEDANF